MKKTVCIFVVLFAIFSLAKAQKIVKVGAFNYYPAIFMDTDGAVKGFYVDALNELGEKENLKFIYVFGTWNEGLERIKTGEVDILTSVAITEERLNYMDYTTTPTLTVWSEVYVKPKSEIKGILDLNGKTVAVMKSDFNGIYIKQLTEKLSINCNFIETTDFEEVFKLINAGNVDAGVVSNIFGAPKSIEYQLISSGIVFNPFDIYFTVKKDSNQDLLKLLNTTLHNWKHDRNSVLNSARQKWSHANVGAIEVFPTWLQKAVYTTLFMVLALVALIAFLRYKIGVATKSIKESEERFILAMKASNDGLFDWNLETNDIYYSPGWKKMLGYEDYELPNDFSVWENFTDPEDVKKTMELIEKLKSKQIDRFVIEFKTRHKKGHWVDILARGEAFFNKQGKAIRIVGTHVDITERKKAEETLKENSEKYKAMANDLNKAQSLTKVGSWKWYFDENRLEWSDEMYRIFGIEKDKFTGILTDVIQQSIHPDDRAMVEASNNSVVEKGAPIPLEYRIVMPNGTIKTVWAEAGEIIMDNASNPSVLTGIVQDITERKLAEEAIKESENKYRQLFDLSPVGTLVVGMDKRFIKCNAAFCNFIGYTENELIGKHISEITYPEDIDLGMNEIKQIANGSTEAATVEKRYLRKDGQIVWGNVAISIVKDANHNPLFLIPIIQDITLRKQAEIELMAAKEKAEESELKYRTIFEGSPIGIFRSFKSGKFIEVNQSLATMLGYQNPQEVLDNVFDISKQIYVETSKRDIVVNYSTKENIRRFENTYKRKNGDHFNANLYLREIIDEKGNPILEGMVEETTIIKRKEKELLEAKEKAEENETYLRTVLQSFDDVIVSRDLNNNAVFFNRAFELVTSELFNQPAHIGLNTLKLLSNENREFWENTLNKVKNGEESSIEYNYTTPSNTTKYYLTSHMPIFNGSNIIGTLEITKDITIFKQREAELKIAKEKVEESEENLRFLFENMIQGVVYHKPTGDIIRANKAAASILGLSLDQLYGKTSLDPRFKSIHEDGTEYPGETHPVMKTIKTKKPVKNSIMGIYIPEKNMYSWININSIPKFNPKNELIQVVVTFEDITEIRNAKEKAEESDERLRNLVDSTDAIIWEADAQTFKFTFVSKQAERLLGYPVDAWYADGFWADHLFEDDKEAAINNCVYSPKQKLNRDFECRFVSKDGRIVWLRDVVNVVIKDQEPYVLRGVMFDITAIKLAQEALKESEEKLSALFASMTEMVALHELVFDEYGQPVNYRITDCNTAFTQVTGIKKEDAIGKLATELYGTKTPPYFEEYKQVAISQVPHTYNTYFAPMDKHFSISVVSPKKNQFATITTDITALQQIQNIISAKNKELENYLYVSSHDLRSPLVNIQGFSQRLQKQINSINSLVQECYLKPEVKTNLTQITDEAIPETLNFIFTSVAKMDILINSLLQISRVGRVKMEIKNIDTNLLITNIIKQLNFQLSEISATVKVGKLPNCYGDENTLNQLFSNLLDNAIKYRNPNISLLVNIEGKVIYNKVIYSIKDNGIGIAAKYLNKIWDVFYRIDPSINENGEGIGLSIVKRIIDKHKGKIWVESEEGMGTTFYIELLIKEFEE